MLSILKDQRLNGKIPFLLPHSVKIAHKTGEDDGITHDVGIVYARGSRLLCASVANMYRHRNSSAQCRISP